jgi:hypothetical protein
MAWIDRLDVENILRIVAMADVEVGIVLKGNADQISDGILRGLAQVFALLSMRHCCDKQDGHSNGRSKRCDTESASASPHCRH